MSKNIKLYEAKVPVPTGGEQSLVLIEKEDQRYGFISCLCSGGYGRINEEMTDDLKKYMEDNQVTPLEVHDSELVKLVLESAQITRVGVSKILSERLIALLESI